MRTAVNRVLLALVGLVLIAVGGTVLFGALDLARHWGFGYPSWWPYTGPHQVLLPAHDRTRYRGESWWWTAVIAALAVLALAALWWLLAQAGRRRTGRVAVGTAAHGGFGEAGEDTVRGRALEEALAADAETLPGVAGCGVRLTRRRPRGGAGRTLARMGLLLEGGAVPAEVVAGLEERVLADARRSTGLPVLPAEVRMHGERHRPSRVD